MSLQIIENAGQGDCLYYAFRDTMQARGVKIFPDNVKGDREQVQYLRNQAADALEKHQDVPLSEKDAKGEQTTIQSAATAGNLPDDEDIFYGPMDWDRFLSYTRQLGQWGEFKAIIGLSLAYGHTIKIVSSEEGFSDETTEPDLLQSAMVTHLGEIVLGHIPEQHYVGTRGVNFTLNNIGQYEKDIVIFEANRKPRIEKRSSGRKYLYVTKTGDDEYNPTEIFDPMKNPDPTFAVEDLTLAKAYADYNPK